MTIFIAEIVILVLIFLPNLCYSDTGRRYCLRLRKMVWDVEYEFVLPDIATNIAGENVIMNKRE